jgi:UDP-N-acetylmuramoylalanine--D-glutamate ligase
MDIKHKKVLVFGTGISGMAAVKLLQQTEADITLYDGNVNLNKEDIAAKLPKDFKGNIILGELPGNLLKQLDLVVLSPGVPTDLEIVNKIRDNQIPIWGEVELAYYFSKGKIAAITGTNGKTTTTTLVGEIMKTYYNSVFVVGNIGVPYTEMVLNTTEDSITVAEMSSFQLETIHEF